MLTNLPGRIKNKKKIKKQYEAIKLVGYFCTYWQNHQISCQRKLQPFSGTPIGKDSKVFRREVKHFQIWSLRWSVYGKAIIVFPTKEKISLLPNSFVAIDVTVQMVQGHLQQNFCHSWILLPLCRNRGPVTLATLKSNIVIKSLFMVKVPIN